MNIELHRNSSIFEALTSEWNALLDRSVSRVPFLRAEYQRGWWAHRGGGEWPESELVLAAARDESGRLLGLAPLFAAKNREGRPALLLGGSIEISDYLDVVVERAQAEAFWAVLLERLTQPDVPAWEVLDVYNIPEASPTRAALARAATGRGWATSEQVLEPVPAIPLPGDWETYLARQVEKKERQEIRRKMRRAEGGEDVVAWHIVHPTGDIAAETETFMAMMALNPDKARFLTPAMRAQFHATTRAAAEGGWLHLSWLTVNGERAAGYLSEF
jgi:CelD/BcsL family acetyltransferase involved in cellulose biosynthesis